MIYFSGMKKLILPVFLISLLSGLSTQSKGQAWTKDTKHVKVTLGAFAPFILGYYGDNSTVRTRNWDEDWTGWRIVGLGRLTFDAEFGVHENIGVGFTLGAGGGAGNHVDYGGSFNLSYGVFANYHFAHLLNLSNKLDLYGGVNLGFGNAFVWHSYTKTFRPPNYFVNPQHPNYGVVGRGEIKTSGWNHDFILFGGFQLGANYFITENMGLTAEVGFGKTVVSAGLVFKR